MRLDIFSEMQHPKELWTGPDHEHRLIQETLEEARLADEMGYGVWWQVEHHAAVEFSYSSAPEIMLTAIATSTKNLHVGHSSVLAPTRFNHPIRIAERSAFIDHLSGGRFQLGLARSTIPEWRTFNIEGDTTRGQMQQSFELLEPVGEFVNNQVAFFTFVHCADSEREAMENGAAKAAAWYTAGSFTFFEAKDAFVKTAAELEVLAKDPAGGGLTGQYLRNKNPNAPQSQAQRILGRIMSGENVPDEQVWEVLSGQDSLIVGTQDQVRKGLKRYEALGIDALMSFHQVGALTHDKVMKSIRLTGGLIPEFKTPAPP
ncbi:MAG: LLM class flavin-dependent oxidoreductase [Myxococcaceae bacterium]|nr:MAG: LLM class flavin-dependent oxidoreductase [Myxococcaceae bacterium]